MENPADLRLGQSWSQMTPLEDPFAQIAAEVEVQPRKECLSTASQSEPDRRANFLPHGLANEGVGTLVCEIVYAPYRMETAKAL